MIRNTAGEDLVAFEPKNWLECLQQLVMMQDIDQVDW